MATCTVCKVRRDRNGCHLSIKEQDQKFLNPSFPYNTHILLSSLPSSLSTAVDQIHLSRITRNPSYIHQENFQHLYLLLPLACISHLFCQLVIQLVASLPALRQLAPRKFHTNHITTSEVQNSTPSQPTTAESSAAAKFIFCFSSWLRLNFSSLPTAFPTLIIAFYADGCSMCQRCFRLKCASRLSFLQNVSSSNVCLQPDSSQWNVPSF